MKTKEIQARLERGYTMAIYGTRENIHEQMKNDINELLEAINYIQCCTELKDKEEITFEEWKKRHLIDRNHFNNTYLHDTEGWIEEHKLIDKYNNEVMITLKQLKNKLHKDFGWENLESDDNKWFVDNLLKDTIQAINDTRCCETLNDKKIKDLLNWVKSDLAQEENVKLGKTATPYRFEKLRFLRSIEKILSL